MKIIFDFDDVLFDSVSFKRKVFSYFDKYGLGLDVCELLYKKHRADFSLRNLYEEVMVYTDKAFTQGEFDEFHDNSFFNFESYLNNDLVTIIEKVGKENCFVLTAGNESFQYEKIVASGLSSYIDKEHIIIVKDDKKEALRELCKLHVHDSIIFVDDKEVHAEGARSLDLSNLHVVLYDTTGFASLVNTVNVLSV